MITNIETLAFTVAGSALPIGPPGVQGPAGPIGQPGPVAKADLSTITAAMRGHISGLKLSNDASVPNNIVDVAVGVATDTTAAMMLSLTTPNTVDLTTTGVGGLDTGSVEASSWYAIFVIGGDAGVALTATKMIAGWSPHPTLPSGYAYYRYIGAVKTDGSSHVIPFQQMGQYFYWQGSPSTDVSGSSSSPVLFATNVPLGLSVVPLISVAGQGSNSYVWSPLQGSTAPSNMYQITGAGTFFWPVSCLMTNTSAQLYYKGPASVSVCTFGWIDLHCSPALNA